MRAKQLEKVIIQAFIHGKRLLIIGAPGMGKTALIKQCREKVAEMLQKEVALSVLYASISDPTDFKGFYAIIDGKPEIVPFGELEKIFNATSLHIVFLDDFGLSTPAVQGAAMSFLDRCKDNPNVVIIAASNRKQDKSNVSGMLESVKTRFSAIIEMEFNNQDWLDMYVKPQVQAGNLPIEFMGFFSFRPNIMYQDKPTLDLVNSLCPRTAEELGTWLMIPVDPESQFEVYKGCAGESVATELLGYLPIWKQLPNVNQIINYPEQVTMPPATEEYAASVYFAVSVALAKRANEQTIENIIKFAERCLPVEFQVALNIDCVRECPAIQDTKHYAVWQSKHKDVYI